MYTILDTISPGLSFDFDRFKEEVILNFSPIYSCVSKEIQKIHKKKMKTSAQYMQIMQIFIRAS